MFKTIIRNLYFKIKNDLIVTKTYNFAKYNLHVNLLMIQ